MTAVVFSAFVLLTTSAAYALFQYSFASLEKLDVFGEGHQDRAKGGAVNYLLVGSDSAEGLTEAEIRQFRLGHEGRGGQRSDTMLLLHIPADRSKALVVSFPRDSYVKIPAYEDSDGDKHAAQFNKLNAAFSFGGPRLAIRTIEANTGVTIHHYVQVNVLGLAKVVDSVGGVDVCVPRDIDDPLSNLHLTAGRHHVGGVTAVAYARNRTLTPDADLGRIKRQQALLGSLINRVTSTGMLLRPDRLVRFVNAATDAVKVDESLDKGDILQLAERFKSLNPKHVTFMTVPLATPASVDHGIGSTVDWHPTKAKKLFADIEADRPVAAQKTRKPAVAIAPSNIALAVRNGTDTQGLASRAADDLRRVGFAIRGTPSNADNPVAETVVRYGPSRADSAETVKAAVPGAKLEEVADMGSQIEIVVGSNYEGAQRVRVRSSSPSSGNVRTAADNPCT